MIASPPVFSPTSQRLLPLLEPRSIAIVGASDREGSFGHTTLTQTLARRPDVPVYPVNPRQKEMLGHRCYASVAELPEPADLVIFAVANAMLEEQVALAIRSGCKAGVIFASCYMEGDGEPALPQRLRTLANAAGFPICGANCMGYFNPGYGSYASWYAPGRLEAGPIGLVSHSGTLFITLAANDRRYGYSLIVSAGQELTVTAADYVHYMLDCGRTRVVALILEAVRDPAGFTAALEKAEAMDVPVVAIKIGRTDVSARLAKSHSGAITGDDAAYEALFERHGVLRVQNVDEMMATATVMAMPKRAHRGGVAAVLDSGGARGLFLDLASDLGVPMSQIDKDTEKKLRNALEYGLEPVNPVDAWGTGHEFERRFRECLQAVTDDPDTGFAVMLSDITNDEDPLSGAFGDIAVAVSENSPKPVIMATHWGQLHGRKHALELCAKGVPYLDGTQNVLAAIRHAFAYRDFRALPKLAPPAAPSADVIARWRQRLTTGAELSEAEGLALLSDFGIAVPASASIGSAAELAEALGRLRLPVAIKTATPGIHHKSDVGGVRLGLRTRAEAEAAYADLAGRLGPRALVAEMAGAGVELAVGLVRDPQFGPVVIVGAGGTMIEVLKDRRVALPPLDEVRAGRLVDRLRLRPLLGEHRKRPAADLGRLAGAIAAFSVLAATLGDLIEELDVNPLIAGPHGAIAVDALVLPRQPG